MKQIQEWLGHSDFAITANTYAHLEFDSKLASAQAMTWIDRTSLAQDVEEPIALHSVTDNLQEDVSLQALPDMLSELLASGAPLDVVQAWLKQDDLGSSENIVDHFKNFAQSYGIDYNKNCQPTLV